MRKILVILLFLGVLNLYAQERTDLIDRHFQGEITKRAAGDSINTNKPYPYQDYKFYYREEELMAFYNEDDDGTMGLDIYFTEK